MKKLLLLLVILLLIYYTGHSQTVQPYGVIDTADLRMSDCSFEKGANAMVLFDKAEVTTKSGSVEMTRHRRIKIFNEAGRDIANERLQYYSYKEFENISSVEAQTINLEGNNIVVTPVDPGLIYIEVVDKYRKALVFAFPKVKPGCVIEYTYKWKTTYVSNFPKWNFQDHIPTRYSELEATISGNTEYDLITKGYQPFVKDSGAVMNKPGKNTYHWWAKANIPAYTDEPFTPRGGINLESLDMRIHALLKGGALFVGNDSWKGVAFEMMVDKSFGPQLNVNLHKEDGLIKQVESLKTDDEKIAFLFNEVKKSITWNKVNNWYTNAGVKNAWERKTGNSTEINLILYHLLKKMGIEAYPMVVYTRDDGVIDPFFATYEHIDKTVVYISFGVSVRYYVLDASSQYNVYNEVPAEFLNTYGVRISPQNFANKCKLIFLQNEEPAREVVITNGEIKADSKVTGTTEIASYSYNRGYCQRLYDKLGEKKYVENLRKDNGDINIWDLSVENMAVDSLPLMQKFKFGLNLTGSDEQYIYFNPNLFTPLRVNPFLSEQRYTDIDFGHCNAYSINGTYKLPPGYKIDALPKSLVLSMSDKSITFKRVIGELNGALQVHYNITYTRATYSAAEYKPIREFYKKMYDMLNEPIVLKKG